MTSPLSKHLHGAAVLLCLSAAPALAQDSQWTYNLSFYLWFSGTGVTADTPQGTVDAELSFSDAVQDLDFAFMGTAEARNGPWGIIGDLIYMNLTADDPTPKGLAFSEASVGTKMTVLTGVLAYRIHEDDSIALDLGAGFRGFWGDTDITLVGAPGGAPTETLSQTKNWVDPIVAARMRVAFSDQWFGTAMVDAGGTGDTSTWQALATVGYLLNENWAIQGGYRYMEAEWDTDYGTTSMDFSGPILGVTYRF
jgi:opacity protein-like surface antigen